MKNNRKIKNILMILFLILLIIGCYFNMDNGLKNDISFNDDSTISFNNSSSSINFILSFVLSFFISVIFVYFFMSDLNSKRLKETFKTGNLIIIYVICVITLTFMLGKVNNYYMNIVSLYSKTSGLENNNFKEENLLKVIGNPEENIELNVNNQKLYKNIELNNINSLLINLSNSTFIGSINSKNDRKYIKLIIDSNSKLTLISNSYISELENENKENTNIDFNGFKLYVNGKIVK